MIFIYTSSRLFPFSLARVYRHGDRRRDNLRRIRRAVHGVGTHKSKDRAETLGVAGSNLPVTKDKHRADLYSQRIQHAIDRKHKRSKRKRKKSRAGRRLARAAARLARERPKAALVKVATYNVRNLSVEGVNGSGRDEVEFYEAAAKKNS